MSELRTTPLHDLHARLGAKFVPFAGYEMPVQYAAGVMKEHLHTRAQAGLFDVSHMGQVRLSPLPGKSMGDVAQALEALLPQDVAGLREGRQRYGFFTNGTGGILDDLMFANRGDHIFVVVNAACKDADVAHMSEHLSQTCAVEVITDRALVALQGPASEAALACLLPDVRDMQFMDVATLAVDGIDLWISRSGYTGEDGFEISMPSMAAEALTERLLADDTVAPIGLGARDSLRLEAGLCLYGNDIDTTTTPVEAALNWAIQKARKPGGARPGGYPGADVIARQLSEGAARKRVGLAPQGRAPMRAGTALFAGETSADPIGKITSGGFGPSVARPVAMGYVPAEHAAAGTQLFAELRGKRLPVEVAALPFVPPGFKR